MDQARWLGVAPDLLRDIAGRLHDASDFVRFHAVCKPWRDSRDGPPNLSRTTILPWLLAPADKDSTAPFKLRCIFSRSSYRAPPPPPDPVRRRNWISRADGTAVLYMTVEHLRPSLHDPFNGEDVTDLPSFGWDEGDPHGIVYADDTILLYNVYRDGATARFRAALPQPGQAKWAIFKRTFENPTYGEFCVAYHRGKIIVSSEATLVTPAIVGGDVLVPGPHPLLSYPLRNHQDSYVLESRGELLRVSVDDSILYSRYRCLSLSVHVLEEQTPVSEKMSWVKKAPHCLADRVLFLGFPCSFAIDASQLGGHGGFAFFVYSSTKALPGEKFGVFKCNLIDNKTIFIERLPPGWDYKKCMWLIPHPAISSVQEISTRALMANEPKPQQTVTSPTRISHMLRYYEPSMTVSVQNIPLSANMSHLQLLFSNHGKVSHTKIVSYDYTKSWKAHLTIKMVHDHQEDVVDALNGLVLHGCRLEVSLVKEEKRRWRHGRLTPEYLVFLGCSYDEIFSIVMQIGIVCHLF